MEGLGIWTKDGFRMKLTDKITVLNEDCMKVMAQYPDKYFDLAVVDPDFGLNEKISSGGTWASKYKKQDGFLGGKPTAQYFQELFRVSKNQIIWGGNYFIDMLYPTRCVLVWDKVAKMDTLADFEMAWTSFDANSKIFQHVRNTSETRIHICQKPIKLYDWIFKNYACCKSCNGAGGYYEDVVGDGGSKMWFDCEDCEGKPMKILDTHGGSMSSVISADKAGLEMVCCELDKEYFDKAVERFQRYKSQLTLAI